MATTTSTESSAHSPTPTLPELQEPPKGQRSDEDFRIAANLGKDEFEQLKRKSLRWVVSEALDWGYWDTVPTRLKTASLNNMQTHISGDTSLSPGQLHALDQQWFANFLLHRRWRINRNNREKNRRNNGSGTIASSVGAEIGTAGMSEAAEAVRPETEERGGSQARAATKVETAVGIVKAVEHGREEQSVGPELSGSAEDQSRDRLKSPGLGPAQ